MANAALGKGQHQEHPKEANRMELQAYFLKKSN